METPDAFWQCRPRPFDETKTIVVTGAARGGTTFGASIVAHLGVPFDDDRNRVGRRYSHAVLMDAFGTNDFVRTAREVDEACKIWAFKHPSAVSESEFVLQNVRRPHYIIVFKEPLSVAMRGKSIKDKELTCPVVCGGTEAVLKHYLAAVQFARSAEVPVLLLSYDRALRDLPNAIAGVARFLGVENADTEAVADRVAGDKDKYFELTKRRQAEKLANE